MPKDPAAIHSNLEVKRQNPLQSRNGVMKIKHKIENKIFSIATFVKITPKPSNPKTRKFSLVAMGSNKQLIIIAKLFENVHELADTTSGDINIIKAPKNVFLKLSLKFLQRKYQDTDTTEKLRNLKRNPNKPLEKNSKAFITKINGNLVA